MNEHGEVVRNITRLVWKGYSQKKGIEYEETFPPIAKMEDFMFLTYVEIIKFKVY